MGGGRGSNKMHVSSGAAERRSLIPFEIFFLCLCSHFFRYFSQPLDQKLTMVKIPLIGDRCDYKRDKLTDFGSIMFYSIIFLNINKSIFVVRRNQIITIFKNRIVRATKPVINHLSLQKNENKNI